MFFRYYYPSPGRITVDAFWRRMVDTILQAQKTNVLMKNHRALRACILAGVVTATALATAKADTIYVSDNIDNTITMIASNGTETTFGAGDLNGPTGLAVDPLNGDIYVANNGSGQIAEFTPGGTFLGDLSSTFNNPRGLAFDSAGNLFVANQSSNSVSEVTPGGTVSTFVGTGLDFPNGLAFDSAGNLYIANGNGDSTITVATPGGMTSTLNVSGHPLNWPNGVAFDSAGNLYVVNNHDPSVEKITAGVGTVFASTGLSDPKGLAIDSSGDVWVTDFDTNQVVEYNSLGNLINTFTNFSGPCLILAVPSSLPVPEPSTYAMLVLGLGLVAYVNRRRLAPARI